MAKSRRGTEAAVDFSNPLLLALFAQARSDLQSYLPPALLATGNPLEGVWGYKSYRAAQELQGNHLPLAQRERAAREVVRLVGLLGVHDEAQRTIGLTMPVVPDDYTGGDSLLDAVLSSDCREGLKLLIGGAISAYLECLDPPLVDRYAPLKLAIVKPEYALIDYERRDAVGKVIYKLVEQHLCETGQRPKPNDILRLLKASEPIPGIRATATEIKYFLSGDKAERTLTGAALSKRIGRYLNEL